METIGVPLLPTSLWILASAMMIIVMLVFLFLYLYERSRVTAIVKDAHSAAELAAQLDILQARKEECVKWIHEQEIELERLACDRKEQEIIRADLERLEQECSSKDQENQALRNEVGELENQRHMATQTLERLHNEMKTLEEKREEAKAIEQDLPDLQNHLRRIREELTAQQRVLEETSGNLVKSELRLKTMISEELSLKDRIEKSRDESQVVREDTRKYSERFREAKSEFETLDRHLAEMRETRAQLEVTTGRLRDEERELSKRIESLEGRRGNLDEGEEGANLTSYADLFGKVPGCLSKSTFSRSREDMEEYLALQKFDDHLRYDGLIFAKRVIDAFHTALKCQNINPLTVLAGVSGTGKTLLPIRYARVMGMHSLVMAVQPRWDSPQDMFGFYDYLERQYKATDLSRALVRMDPYNYKSEQFSETNEACVHDRLLLVLLDEMNLARTEYYFSEFLSKLELRRLVKDENDESDRERAEIELDTGPGILERLRIWVGDNVFFVGTMNEDETTQTLSDKVLDRSNVLRFGKPSGRTQQVNQVGCWPEEYLTKKQWRSWIKPIEQAKPWHKEVVSWTNKINEALDRLGRPFGYRVQVAIEAYIANYPRVDEDGRHKLAFGDQLEQKIIPKLRGIDMDEQSAVHCLDEIREIISGLGDNELREAFEESLSSSERLGMFQWRGVSRSCE